MKIILDAMGGDNAPQAVVSGAVRAARELDTDIVLVGREDEVKKCLAACGGADEKRISIVNASQVVTMEDEPVPVPARTRSSGQTLS